MLKVRRKIVLAFRTNSQSCCKYCEIQHTSGTTLTVPACRLTLV